MGWLATAFAMLGHCLKQPDATGQQNGATWPEKKLLASAGRQSARAELAGVQAQQANSSCSQDNLPVQTIFWLDSDLEMHEVVLALWKHNAGPLGEVEL